MLFLAAQAVLTPFFLKPLHRPSAVFQLKLGVKATQVWACAVNLCHTTWEQALSCLASPYSFPPVLQRAKLLRQLIQSPAPAESLDIRCCMHGKINPHTPAQSSIAATKYRPFNTRAFISWKGLLPFTSSQLDYSSLLSSQARSTVAW